MASLFERRIPAVYVDVEDYSYLEPAEDANRQVFGVIVSDRGPHNQVVRISSVPQFIRLFGKPNDIRTSLMHYQIEMALRYTSYVYVIRASLIDSDIEAENAAIANTVVKYNSPDGSDEQIFGKFVFTSEADAETEFGVGNTAIAQYVFTDIIGFEQFKINDYIYSGQDDTSKALKIIERGQLTIDSSKYYLKLSGLYQGTTDVDQDNANALLVTFTDVLANLDYTDLDNYDVAMSNSYVQSFSYEYYPGVESIVGGLYTFTNGSDIVVCSNETSYDAVSEEQWIYPSTLTSAYARQVIKKQINETTSAFELKLDSNYTGVTSVAPEAAKQYVPFEMVSQINVRELANLDPTDIDNTFYFKAIGTGTYYNRIFIRGVRNLEYEKLYQTGSANGGIEITEEDPDNIYKYAFLDITINQMNEDGTYTILEGPWTVSLINNVNRGIAGIEEEVVVDPYTGRQLYLPFVLNTQSDFIECVESIGSNVLYGSDSASEIKRLQFMSLLSEGTIVGSTVRGKEGFFLENGEDGILYSSNGRVNLQNGRIKGVILRAYNGTLPSADSENSIQKIIQELYPKYTFDYILSGGYTPEVQKAAADLAWMRQSMLLLADTGGYKISAQEDLTARQTLVPWNNWSAALYTQYRKVFDPYTGKKIWMTPVYHAIERHLRTDRDYWIAEPVAGIEKGAIEEPIEIAYDPDINELGDLIEAGMNPTILESDGVYIFEQLTTWKRFSKLREQYVVKFVHHLRKVIPVKLKDILFRKADTYWKNQAYARINNLLAKYAVPTGPNAALSSYKIDLFFDDNTNVLHINVIIQPIGVIKRIRVTLKIGNPNG